MCHCARSAPCNKLSSNSLFGPPRICSSSTRLSATLAAGDSYSACWCPAVETCKVSLFESCLRQLHCCRAVQRWIASTHHHRRSSGPGKIYIAHFPVHHQLVSPHHPPPLPPLSHLNSQLWQQMLALAAVEFVMCHHFLCKIPGSTIWTAPKPRLMRMSESLTIRARGRGKPEETHASRI